MIRKLEQALSNTSQLIFQVFQRSYAVEAEFINHPDFPPLKRTAQQIQQSKTTFYGFFKNNDLRGVMELELAERHIHVRSLTVDPDFFRQGIGRTLLSFVLDEFTAPLITVETGHLNKPAIDFYLDFGFQKNKIWMTDVGIEKISFTFRRTS